MKRILAGFATVLAIFVGLSIGAFVLGFLIYGWALL